MRLLPITVELELPFYEAEEIESAQKDSIDSGHVVYTWSSSGRSNWLSRGLHMADRLGYILLPQGLPDQIDIPDDAPEEGDDEEPTAVAG